jgi:hypothetical protein
MVTVLVTHAHTQAMSHVMTYRRQRLADCTGRLLTALFFSTVGNFKNCTIGTADFDSCVLNALNSVQKYFHTGKLFGS